MATPRELTSPPISEALVDLRAAVSAPTESFEALSHELKTEYPKTVIRRGVRAELKVEHGKLIPPTAEDLGFQGIWLHNAAGTAIVQLRPDGFTFNNLKSYMGGDSLISAALQLWSRFDAQMQPPGVTRVALRYINQLRLPFKDGDDFSRFLTAVPTTPEGAPQRVSEFLSRVVAHDHGEDEPTVITTQQLAREEPNKPVIVIDVDTFIQGEFSADARDLRPVLDRLRALKNRTFFSLLTDEAVNLFL
jgi:uncharacterized protein (TIGR04255 family)